MSKQGSCLSCLLTKHLTISFVLFTYQNTHLKYLPSLHGIQSLRHLIRQKGNPAYQELYIIRPKSLFPVFFQLINFYDFSLYPTFFRFKINLLKQLLKLFFLIIHKSFREISATLSIPDFF